MKIYINEMEYEISEEINLGKLRELHKPEADIVILNSFPGDNSAIIAEGDRITLIKRGETPSADELQAMISARHTPGLREKVRQAKIGIAGLGGLGSNIAIALARVGIGKMILADFDVVEPSNLGRQQYFVDQIGMAKTAALATTLFRTNPSVNLVLRHTRVTPKNVKNIFGDCDIVIEAFDRAEEKTMLIESVMTEMEDTYIIAASGVAGHGPASEIKVNKVSERFYVVGDLKSEARPFTGLMAPRVGVAAHIQANLALRILMGEMEL